jgi:hypothetical protein
MSLLPRAALHSDSEQSCPCIHVHFFLSLLSCPSSPVFVVMFRSSSPLCLVQVDVTQLPRPGSPVPVLLSWLSFPPVLAVIPTCPVKRLSRLSCPVSVFLSQLSCPVMFWQACNLFPLTVSYRYFYPHCPL